MERTRTVKDYLDLLDESTGLLLVGGQAVNLWAERYQAEEPAILEYQPFTSRDADFYRRAPKLRLPPNWTELPLPTKGRMRIVTHALQGPEGQTAEVIRSVNGLTQQELEDGSIAIEYGGRSMWFLVPAALFQAKLANLKSIDQEGRQDLKHLKLLIPVTRCFFRDLLTQHTSSERLIPLYKILDPLAGAESCSGKAGASCWVETLLEATNAAGPTLSPVLGCVILKRSRRSPLSQAPRCPSERAPCAAHQDRSTIGSIIL